MPWRTTLVVTEEDQKLKLVSQVVHKELSLAAACAAAGVSRKTGYKWLARYREGGASGLKPRSRAAHRHGRAMAQELARLIVGLRRRQPSWGARKLKTVLEHNHPELKIPAASTIGDLLRRKGLCRPPRRRLRAQPAQPFAEVRGPNDLWCADFKGWFRTADGQRCDPLTISDAHSRLLLECRIVAPSYAQVQLLFERAFRRYGYPRAIRTDNGEPFASAGTAGLSRLSVQWLKAGIALERIAPGKPQENGRHERMHRTLKAETATPPAADAAQQQARFDRFRRCYNHRRPHEALGQTVPAAHYSRSPRRYREQLPDPCYDADHQVARVRSDGAIKWCGELVYLTEALAGELVGIAEVDCDRWLVRFATVELGTIERATPGILRRSSGAGAQRSHSATSFNRTGKVSPMHPVQSVTYASG